MLDFDYGRDCKRVIEKDKYECVVCLFALYNFVEGVFFWFIEWLEHGFITLRV